MSHAITLQAFGHNSHGPSCPCCSSFLSGRDVTVKMFRVNDENQTVSPNQAMSGFPGDLFDSIGDLVGQIVKAISSMIGAVLRAVSDLIAGILKAFERINWEDVFSELGKMMGEAQILLNPIHQTNKLLKSFPLTSHLYKELDKLTGGAISTIDNLSTITGRALRGDAISKQEVVQNLMFCLKVAAVLMAGPVGSMAFNAMLVAQVAGQLKQGTLGQTELGRTILGVCEVAGYAYFAGSAITDAVANKALDEGQTYVLTKTPIGQGDLGPIIAGLAFTSASAGYNGQDQWGSLTNFSKDYARSEATSEVAVRVGGPYAKDIAKAVVKAGEDGKFNPAAIDFTAIPNGYSFNQFLEDTAKAYGNVKESIVNYMNSEGGQSSFPTLDFTGAGDAVAKFASDAADKVMELPGNIIDEVKRIPDNLAKIPAPSMPSISSPKFPGLSVPDISSPSFDLNKPVIDWDSLYDVVSFMGLRALYRRQNVLGGDGKRYTVYVLEDGTIYYELMRSNTALYLLLGAAAVAAGSTFV